MSYAEILFGFFLIVLQQVHHLTEQEKRRAGSLFFLVGKTLFPAAEILLLMLKQPFFSP